LVAGEVLGASGATVSGGGVQSCRLLIAGSKSTASSAIVAGTGFGVDSLEKCLLTVSAFFLGAFSFAGFVTLAFGSVVWASVATLGALGFLFGFSGGKAFPACNLSGFGSSLFFFLGFLAAGVFFCFAPCTSVSVTVFSSGGSTVAFSSTSLGLGSARDGGFAALSPSIRFDFQTLVAVVNARIASVGKGAALLPVRSAGFLGGFCTKSSIEGNSGDDEMTRTESYCAIRAGVESKSPPDANRNTAHPMRRNLGMPNGKMVKYYGVQTKNLLIAGYGIGDVVLGDGWTRLKSTPIHQNKEALQSQTSGGTNAACRIAKRSRSQLIRHLATSPASATCLSGQSCLPVKTGWGFCGPCTHTRQI